MEAQKGLWFRDWTSHCCYIDAVERQDENEIVDEDGIATASTTPTYMRLIGSVFEADISIKLRLAGSLGCKPDRVIVRIVRLHYPKKRFSSASDDAYATCCGVCCRLKH